MDVSPMSLQMIVPRATDAGQVQHNLNQANALQSDFQAIKQKADDKLKQQQVRTKDNPEDGKIKDDQEHKNHNGSYYSKRQRQNDDKSEEAAEDEVNYAADPSRGHFLDISL